MTDDVKRHEKRCCMGPAGGAGWSPRGARRVLQIRAALLDGRFGYQAIQLAA